MESLNMSDLAYCRLCVGQRFTENLVDLSSQLALEQQIASKLEQIGVNLSSEDLPKTVCLDCIDQLEKTVLFLDKVRLAEITLRELLNKELEVKEEQLVDECFDNEDYTEEDSTQLSNLKDGLNLVELLSKPSDTEKHKVKEVIEHTGKSWKDYSWNCSKCLDTFDTIIQLREHSISTHKACCTFKCIDCNVKPFINYETFTLHVQKHRNYLINVCLLCNKLFSSKSSFKMHMIEYKSKNVCRVCAEVFPDKKTIDQHILMYAKSIHFSKRLGPKIHQCEVCNKIFKRACQLQVHRAVHSKNRTRDHPCYMCGKSFFTKPELNVHLDMHQNIKKYECDLCNKTFRLKPKLKLHIIRHSGVKPFSCEYCGKNYRFSWDIKRHIKLYHTEELHFTCSFCNKKFRTNGGLKIHIRQHTGEKPFSCEQCCHFFTNHSNYYKHMKRKHGAVFPKRTLLNHKTEPQKNLGSFHVGNIEMGGSLQMYNESGV